MAAELPAPAEQRPMTQTIAIADLAPHGSRVGAPYQGGAWGQSTDAERPTATVRGTLQRFKKGRSASSVPQAFGWVKAVYANAIEFTSMKQAGAGAILVGAAFGLMTGLSVMGAAIVFLLMPILSPVEPEYIAMDVFAIALGALMLLAGLAFTLWIVLTPLRQVWRAPLDLPVIFDRRQRKVYRMVREVQPGLKGLLKPWPVKACAYDWDLLDAEHDAQLIGSAATVGRLHRLVFLVRKSADDPTLIDHFEVGSAALQGEAMVAPMWEHIRRFMEEGGPALPTPDEPLDGRSSDKPTWWQACGQAGPFGSRYCGWWREHPWMTLFMYHGIAAVSLGFCLFALAGGAGPLSLMGLLGLWIPLGMNWGQGTGIWLLAHTSQRYLWPAAVRQAVGPALQRGKGW